MNQRFSLFSRRANALLAKVQGNSYIRDILVTQKIADGRLNPNGEHNLDAVVEPSVSHVDAKYESNTQLVQRTISHVDFFAQRASQLHLVSHFTVAKEKDLDSNFLYPCNTELRNIAIQRLAQSRDEKSETESFDDALTAEIKNLISAGAVRHMDAKYTHNITRLSFDEGTFFPNKLRGPLDEEGFGELVSRLETLAMHLPPNLHLVLPSIPLKTADNRVHLQTIYLQCGPSLRMDVITKAISADIDPDYPGTHRKHFLHKTSGKLVNERDVEDHLPAASCGDEKHPITLNYNNMVRCQTAGGHEFWSAVDICINHRLGTAVSSLIHTVAYAMEAKCETLPEKVTHVLVSNPQRIYKDKVLGNIVVHVDPRYSSLYDADSKDAELLMRNGARDMQGIFGGTATVKIFEPRAIDPFQEELLDTIKEHNRETALLRYSLLKAAPHDVKAEPAKIDIDKQNQMYQLC